MTALSKSPSARYASAGALADDLARVVEGRAVVALPLRRWRRRLCVGSLFLLVAVGCALGWRHRRTSQPPVVFELPTILNSAGMRLVRVPGGTSFLGSPEDEEHRERRERLKTVAVDAFYIATTEVTQRQYAAVMGAAPADQSWAGADWPVHNVSWLQAQAFCRRLSAAEGRTYRLPTEAEWEFACRAGSPTTYSGSGNLDQMGWYAGNSGGRLHPIAEKWANGWGLFDMHGNVREWCEEQRTPGFDARLIRGGSAMQPAHECRAAATSTRPEGTGASDVGFRVVMNVDD